MARKPKKGEILDGIRKAGTSGAPANVGELLRSRGMDCDPRQVGIEISKLVKSGKVRRVTKRTADGKQCSFLVAC